MRERDLEGRPSFSAACEMDRSSKCASRKGLSSSGSTKRGKHACTTARHVARLIAVVRQLTHATVLRRNYDLEQKSIGMYYDMPTTKNFERHFRRPWAASQVQLELATAV